MRDRPQNKQMQRTRRGPKGASPLICVFSGLQGPCHRSRVQPHWTALWVTMLLAASACHYEDRRWAPVAVAHGRTIELPSCLSDHAQRLGQYPRSLAELHESITLRDVRTPACGRLGADFMKAAEDRYAGYRWLYASTAAGAGFLLQAHPVSDRPHQCTFETTEQFILTRSCTRRFLWPSVERTSIARPHTAGSVGRHAGEQRDAGDDHPGFAWRRSQLISVFCRPRMDETMA
jgi:hypothetical protein